MEIPKSSFLILCLFGELFGLILFLQGFLPIRKSIPGSSSFSDIPKEPSPGDFTEKQLDLYIHDLEMKSWQKTMSNEQNSREDKLPPVDPVIGRTVIMLIDALREDFVFGQKGSDNMKFTRHLIDSGQARSFIARAQPPTVTMPRIKAITSGTIPGFMDVVLNLKSGRLVEDNIVSQFHRSGKTMYFFGDDTWLKLFPDHFQTSDGTTSFYVSDYTEVDSNVSRHLPVTLVDKRWDVLILHYLGLDHIGHLAGPNSPLTGHKLQEMDEVIEEIHNALNQQEPAHLPTLFILCGDHGMSDVGSHGGASNHEVHTPLVFLSSAFDSVTDGIPPSICLSEAEDRRKWRRIVNAFSAAPLYGLPDSEIEGNNYPPEVQQIDLAPTLSLLMGTPIPLNSLGGLITELAEDLLPPRAVLRAMQINGHQLAGALHRHVPDIKSGNVEAQKNVFRQGLSLLMGTPIPLNSLGGLITELAEDLLPPRAVLRAMQINGHQLAGALHRHVTDIRSESSFELYQQALRLHSRWLDMHKNGTSYGPIDTMTDKVVDYYSRAQSAMQDRVSSSLAKYDTFAMIFGIIILFQVFFLVWYALYQSSTTPIEGVRFYPLVAGSFSSIFLFCLALTVTCHFVVCTIPGGRCSDLLCSLSVVPLIRAAVGIIFCAGFMSLLLGYLIRKPFTRLGHVSPFETIGAKGLVVGSLIHTASLLSSSFDEEEHQTWYFLSTTLLLLVLLELLSLLGRKDAERIPWGIIIITLGCLILFRLQRSWNQTGIKWAHMPDVADWFMRPEHKLYLTTLMAFSIIIMYLFQLIEHEQMSVFYAAGLVGAVLYRNATDSIDLMLPIPVSHKGIYEAWFTYTVAMALLGRAVINFLGIYSSEDDEDEEPYKDAADRLDLQILPEGTSPWECRPSRAATDFYQAMLVLTVLLLRPHNTAVVAVTVTLQHCIVVYLLPWLQWSPWKMTLLFVWLGQSAFFAQGNSNSAATVDISAGYVGLESHHLVLAAILTSIATFSGPFIWIVRLIMCFSNRYSSRYYHAIQEVSLTLLICRALPIAVYTLMVFFQRYHLFIWSVFSPKLLYEGSHFLLIFCFLIFLQFNVIIVQYFQNSKKGSPKTI